jgi:hypothetical protein
MRKLWPPECKGSKKGEMENLRTHGSWYLVSQALMDGHHLPHQKNEKKKYPNKIHYKNIHISMCGQDFTKTKATRSTIMGYFKFNKH